MKSNLKSRLQNALNNIGQSNQGYGGQRMGALTSEGGRYPVQGTGVHGTMRGFDPATSANSYNDIGNFNIIDDGASDRSNVLNERVQRLQGKITGIE